MFARSLANIPRNDREGMWRRLDCFVLTEPVSPRKDGEGMDCFVIPSLTRRYSSQGRREGGEEAGRRAFERRSLQGEVFTFFLFSV